MKLSFALFVLSVVYIISGVFFSRVKLDSPNKISGYSKDYSFYDYSGVLNVHSNKSNGSGKVQDIITAASAANLDFIVFNETNPIDQQQPSPIKYGKLSVFYGSELSFRNSRFLHFSNEKGPFFGSHSEIQIYISNFLETGGDGAMVLSHPDKPGYEWGQEQLPQYMTGVEVLNLREVWRKAWRDRKLSFLGAVIFYPFNPQLFFLDIYSDEALSNKKWDFWNTKRFTAGYVGSDATSKFRISKKLSLNFPSYKSIFQMAKNHVLLKEELTGLGDQSRIMEALMAGSSYFSIDIMGDPKGFSFWSLTKQGKKIMMGESCGLDEVQSIHMSLPTGVRTVQVDLYRDGEFVKSYDKDFIYKPTEKGAYRLVVKANPFFPIFRSQKWIPWIFSNPILIQGS